MNKKGFTLVEIIAVVAVLAIISLLLFPSLTNLIKRKSDKEYDEFLNQLCQAGEYYVSNISPDVEAKIEMNGQASIRLSELNTNELIKRDMINPKTKQLIDLNSSLIMKKAADGTYSCSI